MTKKRPRSKCPTPSKRRYRDEIAAKIHLSAIQRYGEPREKMPVRAYACACGSWHLTSEPKRGA